VETPVAIYPSMTICNLNYYKKSYVDKHPFIKDFLLAIDPATRNESSVNISDREVIKEFETYSMREIAFNASFTFEEMITECKWQSIEVDCEDYITSTLTNMGYCYTLNSREIIESRGRLNTTRTRADFGFSMEIDVRQYDYFMQNGYSAALRVRRHLVLPCVSSFVKHCISGSCTDEH
jgi:hypothetical protein